MNQTLELGKGEPRGVIMLKYIFTIFFLLFICGCATREEVNSAKVIIPVSDIKEWVWNLNDTRINGIEYSLSLLVPKENGVRYSLGISHFKQQPNSEMKGDIHDFLQYKWGQIWEESNEGGEMIDGLSLYYYVNENDDLVYVLPQETINVVLNDRPIEIDFEVISPILNKKGKVKVKYIK